MAAIRLTVLLASIAPLAAFRAVTFHGHSNATNKAPAMPFFLKTLANECKCQYVGECSCQGSMNFMNCIEAACASGACKCEANQFQHACGAMSQACPSVNLQCTNNHAVCVSDVAAVPPPVVSGPRESANVSTPAAATVKQPLAPAPAAPAKGDGTWYGTLTANFNSIVRIYGVYCLLVLLVAFIYHEYGMRNPPLMARSPGASKPMGPSWLACGFQYCLFDFGNMASDYPMCLMALCCPFIRFAETISRSRQPIMGFWPALLIMLVLFCLEPYTSGVTGVIFLVLWFFWRQRLRSTYKHTHHLGLGAAQDCGMVCCCGLSFSCCMLVQEAREVEYTSPGDSRS